MSKCIVCNNSVGTDVLLTSGEQLHNSCLSGVKKDILELTDRSMAGSFFDLLLSRSNKNRVRIDQLNGVLSHIYDYLPTYPPDWDNRRYFVLDRDNHKCQDCNKPSDSLHIHHKTPIGIGGSNLLSNLICLCEKCHFKKHGVTSFHGGNKEYRPESIFISNSKTIMNAIDQNHHIEFEYKKSKEKNYKIRTIIPKKIFRYTKYNSNTVCVTGHCILRKDTRSFAIKRMREISAHKA